MMNDILYRPQEIGEFVLREIETRRAHQNSGLKFGLPEVDKILLPLRAGELISVIGLAGNFKTGLMTFIARKALEQIGDDQVVVYCTWEQAVEEHGLVELANATQIPSTRIARGEISDEDWERLHKAATLRQATPMWLIGHSITHRDKRPHLTIDNVAQALREMEKGHDYHPALIVVDYLQRVESDRPDRERRVEQMHTVDRCKDLALEMGCPVLLGVQSKQDVLEKKRKIPGAYDAQETSNVAQTSDKILTVWMPKTTEDLGSWFDKERGIKVTENLLVLFLGKQKFGQANIEWRLHVQPDRNEIHSLSRLP